MRYNWEKYFFNKMLNYKYEIQLGGPFFDKMLILDRFIRETRNQN